MTRDEARVKGEPPPTVTRDKAHVAICKAACEILRMANQRKREPMFSKTQVQGRAGFPNVTVNCWPVIIEAIEQFEWLEMQELNGTRSVGWQRRNQALQLLGLTERAFRGKHYETFREELIDNLAGTATATEASANSRRPPSLRIVSPKDELTDLAQRPYDNEARTIAGRFIAQNAGKRTAGYGSVQVAGGKLAWRWLETVGKQIENRRGKATAVSESLGHLGLVPPPPALEEIV